MPKGLNAKEMPVYTAMTNTAFGRHNSKNYCYRSFYYSIGYIFQWVRGETGTTGITVNDSYIQLKQWSQDSFPELSHCSKLTICPIHMIFIRIIGQQKNFQELPPSSLARSSHELIQSFWHTSALKHARYSFSLSETHLLLLRTLRKGLCNTFLHGRTESAVVYDDKERELESIKKVFQERAREKAVESSLRKCPPSGLSLSLLSFGCATGRRRRRRNEVGTRFFCLHSVLRGAAEGKHAHCFSWSLADR